MILPYVAVDVIASDRESPGCTDTAGNVKVVSPAAAATADARAAPLMLSIACAVTVESGSICTSAVSTDATFGGTVNVSVAVPPGIDSGRLGFPRHIACPTAPLP